MQLRNGIVERKTTFLTIRVSKICHFYPETHVFSIAVVQKKRYEKFRVILKNLISFI